LVSRICVNPWWLLTQCVKTIGAVFNEFSGCDRPHWRYYLNLSDCGSSNMYCLLPLGCLWSILFSS
jgi:hypothetical protein